MNGNMDWQHLGMDLDLGFVANEDAWILSAPYTRVDLTPVMRTDIAPRTVDLKLAAGLRNLVQDLIIRLQTQAGELAQLGHGKFGSRHHELIGMPNTETNRNRLKLYVLQCLQQESRLASIDFVQVTAPPGNENRDKVDIRITATARGLGEPFSLVVPFSFEGPLT